MLDGAYHSYKIFGQNNKQKSEKFRLNQLAKEPVIFSYMLYALNKARGSVFDPVSFAELFCADGYFALAAKKFGFTKSVGIDNGQKGYFYYAKKVAKHFKEDVSFINMDVNDIDAIEPVDVVANIGGLYHTKNPQEILEKSYNFANKYLIVQTVVSMNDEDYFEVSPKGRTWGSRFNRRFIEDMVEEYDVIDAHFNELEGNPHPKNRGSFYCLIRK